VNKWQWCDSPLLSPSTQTECLKNFSQIYFKSQPCVGEEIGRQLEQSLGPFNPSVQRADEKQLVWFHRLLREIHMAQRVLGERGDFDRSAFSSLVCLLSLRVRGHQVPNVESSVYEEEAQDCNSNDEVIEKDTEQAEYLSYATLGELKKRFLDRFAEVIANRKGGPHVASTALIETADSASIYMAKNDGFDKIDQEILPTLLGTMSHVRQSVSQPQPVL
jgi:hypothetical protein